MTEKIDDLKPFSRLTILDRVSFTFTADGKREAEVFVLPKIKETGLILAPILPVK